jgi:single-strand DNA-binding protein
MASYNRFVGVGNLVRTVETLNVGQKNTLLAKGTIAINNPRNKEEVTYVDFQAWAGLADIVAKYSTKGNSILIEGELHIQSYDDKEGNKRKATFVKLDKFQNLSSRPTSKAAAAPADNAGAEIDELAGELEEAFL